MASKTWPRKQTILDAMADPALFGRVFRGASWDVWRVLLRALFGLALSGEELETFRRHTGRQTPPEAPAREAWLVVGRRGGKSLIAALVAVWLACFRDYSKLLTPGERGTVMVIAADRRQARVVFRYILGFFRAIPALARLIERETRDSLDLTTGITLEVHTASFRAVRGYTVIAAILDEVAYWPSEESANPDAEIINAIRPGMATVPGALLLGISSPYARRGALWEAYRAHYGQDWDQVLVWQAETRAMNPTVEARVIEDAYAQDEAAACAEYGAEFRRDIEGYIAREAVEACVVPGRIELPPVSGVRYRKFLDFAGGSGGDSATLGVGHEERRGDRTMAVLDLVREVRPPFSPEQVCEDFAAVITMYGGGPAEADRFAGQFPVEQMRRHGVEVKPTEKFKSDIYKELLPLLNSGRVELLDHPRLLAQLAGLERRTARGGRDTIDHGPHGHDDVANSAAGALVLAASAPARPLAPDVAVFGIGRVTPRLPGGPSPGYGSGYGAWTVDPWR